MRRLLGILLVASSAACGSSGSAPNVQDAGIPDAADARPPEAPTWTTVLSHLDGALLSIWGTSSTDLWTVGGPLGNSGRDSLALHFDGSAWTRAKPGGTETYWWVHGSSANDVWFVGEKGRITHWDGTRFEERASGTTATLFGVWAFAPDDAWAVGGVPSDSNAPNDLVLHWDGASWTREVLPEEKHATFFKVWGAANDDVYVVGEGGLVWHRSQGAWKREANGVAKGRLTTVTGCSSNELYAVGEHSVLEKKNGGEWRAVDIALVNDVNGVACAPLGAPERAWGRVVVVGGGSVKLRLVAGTWQNDFGSEPLTDLHGAWVDETGAFWGVGGNFNSSPRAGASREGLVARFGDGAVPSTLKP